MTIVASTSPVTLIGGAGCRTQDLETALRLAPRLVAADAGAAAALAAGATPEAVIGDLDSLPPETAAALSDRLHRIPEQESTDFDKALRSISAPLVIAVGFAGGRFDHELAVMSSLIARPGQRCIVLGPQTLVFHCPPVLRLEMPVGALVSLFPMVPVTASSQGLRWELERLALAPGGRIGTSNAAAAGLVEVRPEGPGLLVILRAEALPRAVRALAAPPPG